MPPTITLSRSDKKLLNLCDLPIGILSIILDCASIRKHKIKIKDTMMVGSYTTTLKFTMLMLVICACVYLIAVF